MSKTLEQYRKDMEAAAKAYETAKAEAQASGRRSIEERVKQLNKDFSSVQADAAAIDLHVYFSDGYDEFHVVEEEEWTGSNC